MKTSPRPLVWLTAMAFGWAMASNARATGPADVLTQHNDIQRSGTTYGETILSPSSVTPKTFGRLATLPVDGQVYAQPLYLHGLDIPDAGPRDVVYIATAFNTLYAFDADSLDPTPLFRVNFGQSVPSWVTTCLDMRPSVGITATPTIDPISGTMYLESRTLDSDGGQHHLLHALDVRNGQDVMTPAEIGASVAVPGQANVDFDPTKQNCRAGLLLANGNVYLAYASLCDLAPYHGWIFSYSASTLQQQNVFLTTPNGSLGGIWMGGGGMVADSQGNVYGAIGNGTMDLMEDGGTDISMSMARWTPDLQLADWFSPASEAASSAKDFDLGPSPSLLFEDQGLLIGGGKEGILWVASSSNLGHQQPDDSQVEKITNPMSLASGWSGIASYQSPLGPELFLWANGMALTSYLYSRGSFSQFHIGALVSYPRKGGCPLSISVDDPDAGTGIVWALVASSNNGHDTLSPGGLHAFQTSDLVEIWSSELDPRRDALGDVAKFNPPTIADGKVFAATFSNQISVYGLVPDDGGDGGELAEDGGDGGESADEDAGDAGVIDGGQPQGTTSGGAGTISQRTHISCAQAGGADDWWWVALPLMAVRLRRRWRD